MRWWLAALIATLAGTAAAEPGAWTCRNLELEVSCDPSGCQTSDAHTPMDVRVGPQRMNVCAYTGCWSGPTARVTRSGAMISFHGVGLPWSQGGETRDAAVTIDANTGVGVILAAGYVNPATCRRD